MSFHGGVVHLYCERWRESGSELLLAAIAAMFFLPARYLNEQSLIFIGRFTEHQSEIVLEPALVYYTLRMSHRKSRWRPRHFSQWGLFGKNSTSLSSRFAKCQSYRVYKLFTNALVSIFLDTFLFSWRYSVSSVVEFQHFFGSLCRNRWIPLPQTLLIVKMSQIPRGEGSSNSAGSLKRTPQRSVFCFI